MAGKITNHEYVAILGLAKEMPIETRNMIGVTIVDTSLDLIVLFFKFLSTKRWFLVAYHHMRLMKMPAAAWSTAYNTTAL